MTASRQSPARTVSLSTAPGPSAGLDEQLADPRRAVSAAREHIGRAALTDTPAGRVGLELEFHLVELARPDRRPSWAQVQELTAALPAMPAGSTVTVEPGGQLELSTPPAPGIVASVAALRTDRRALRQGLLEAGYGAAPLGTDPERPAERVNPAARYVAMERHFQGLGCARAGKAMMTATAALQVNLDAGPRAGWRERLTDLAGLGPVLVAASSASPILAGGASGWHSMRQQVWHDIAGGRSSPVACGEPGEAWASYALDATLMLVRDGEGASPVTAPSTLAQWLGGAGPVTRRPTAADLDYHLTTLFPPVRPRGYLEIRCIDALPDRWWPALATLATVLADDPAAAAVAAEVTAPVAGAWIAAARHGLRDRRLHAAAVGCVRAALERCPPELHDDLDAFAELLESGRTPADELRDRAAIVGSRRLLEEEARA